MTTIRRQYFNPRLSGSFSGVSGFIKNRKFRDKKEVVKELNSLREFALHRPAAKTYPRRRIFVPFADSHWSGDLLDLQKYSKENRGFRYVFILIDGFSRFLMTMAIKDKTGSTLVRAFKKILKTSKRKPRYLHLDQGSEFVNREFKALLKKEGIVMFHTFSKLKAVLAERVIRTLRTRMERYFTHNGNHKYVDALPHFTSSYNSTYHSSIKMAPKDVNKSNEHEVWTNLYDKMIINDIEHPPKANYKVDDLVRISREKLVFEKGYRANWSEEIFRIIKVNQTSPPTYTLEDMNKETISGGFLEPELQLYSRVQDTSTSSDQAPPTPRNTSK
jgi:transposase InsO family protein